jgi:hypothetical protein
MAVVKAGHYRARGGGVAKLRRGIEGRVDRWLVRHGAEVGSGSARWHLRGGDGARLAQGG